MNWGNQKLQMFCELKDTNNIIIYTLKFRFSTYYI